MIDSLRSHADSAVGDGVEAVVKAKHRLRLQRLGWACVYEPRTPGVWAGGDPEPRPGCSLEVLIDGATAFPEMARAMQEAKAFVHLTGWHVAPGFEIVRQDSLQIIGVLLAELAERVDVRVLVWSGAPIPAFHPTRKEVNEAIHNLTHGTRIRCEADPREHPFHCHHEKTIVIDGEVAFVGGIDLTNDGGDRFDSSAHEARRKLGWHDVTTKLQGPAVADVSDHFSLRWKELTGEELWRPEPPDPVGETTVQVVRTVAEGMYDAVPHGDFRVFESYRRALSSAQRLVYLENQFLWAPEIADILVDKLRNPPHPDFRLVILLPAKANNGQDDTRGQLAVLAEADSESRMLAATIRSLSGHREEPLYVHAKVAVIDDRWLIVGSANLNAHSLFNDTEMCVVTDDAELARDTRVRLWAEHLELDPDAVAASEARALVDKKWIPIAREQLERRKSGAEPTHRLLMLPGVSRRSARLLGPLVDRRRLTAGGGKPPGAVDDG